MSAQVQLCLTTLLVFLAMPYLQRPCNPPIFPKWDDRYPNEVPATSHHHAVKLCPHCTNVQYSYGDSHLHDYPNSRSYACYVSLTIIECHWLHAALLNLLVPSTQTPCYPLSLQFWTRKFIIAIFTTTAIVSAVIHTIMNIVALGSIIAGNIIVAFANGHTMGFPPDQCTLYRGWSKKYCMWIG